MAAAPAGLANAPKDRYRLARELGQEGMAWFPSQGPEVHIPAQAREVFDVSGAGDTVVAVMALGLAGWRLDDVITQQQILRLLFRQKELNFVPGTRHLYSNGGYTLAAEVVARVSDERADTDQPAIRPLPGILRSSAFARWFRLWPFFILHSAFCIHCGVALWEPCWRFVGALLAL